MAAALKIDDYYKFEENKGKKKKKKVIFFEEIYELENNIPPKATPKKSFNGGPVETTEEHKVKTNSEDKTKISG